MEVFALRCLPSGLGYRRTVGDLEPAESPDQAAARIAGLAEGTPTELVMHSTSWRHLHDGSLVLTYVVAPDPEPELRAVAVTSFALAHGPDAMSPSPESVSEGQVVAHAACHLALVAETNPHVRRVLQLYPDLRAAMADLPLVPAAQLAG